MVEQDGRTYQAGNGMPNTAKKVLRAMVQSGMAKGSIIKGWRFDTNNLVDGEIHPKKEYVEVFDDLIGINPDAILRNGYGQLCFLYQI